jgi:capsular exopolysaccharide synthesis family protein
MNESDFESQRNGHSGGLLAVPPGAALALANGRSLAAPENGYNGSMEGAADSVSFSTLLHRYSAIAWKHRLLVAGVCGTSLAIGLFVTYLITPIYRATATIQIDREAAKIVKVEEAPDFTVDPGDDLRFYQTEEYLLKSRSLAQHVVANLDLPDAPDFLAATAISPWAKLQSIVTGSHTAAAPSFPARQAVAVGRVQGGLSISPVGSSRLVKISFDSPSPHWAQAVANAVAVNFIKDNLDHRYAATNYARKFLSEKLEDLKLKLQGAERKLVGYAEQKQIVTEDPHQSLESADMNALNAALQGAKVARIHDQELWDQARTTKGLSLPQVLASGTVQTLLNQRAVLAADYQQKLKLFKPDYPAMVQLKAQINGIENEINSAASVIKRALKSQYNASYSQERSLEKQVADAKAGVLNLQGESIDYNILKREVDTTRTLYNGLLQQYKDVGVAGAVGTNNISVVDAATLPGAPYSPDLAKNVAIALALGLVAALALATLLEILDDTFKAPEEIEDQLGLAVLGVIPFVSGDIMRLLNDSPRAAISEAYRSLRTALQFSTDAGVPKTMLVTSARPGDGKSIVAMALAINLAQLGLRVLVIDADLRKTAQGGGHGDTDQPGLSNILTGVSEAKAVIMETRIPGLTFIGSGPLPPNPAELLAGPRMVQLLNDMTAAYDVTILDGAPVMGLADAPLLASLVGGTVLVVAAGEGRRGGIKIALRRLQFARARMIGTVLNKFDFRKLRVGYGYGYGGYGYGNSYGYGHYGYGHFGETYGADQLDDKGSHGKSASRQT